MLNFQQIDNCFMGDNKIDHMMASADPLQNHINQSSKQLSEA